MKKTNILAGILCAVAVVGCGGGGDDVVPPAPAPALPLAGTEGIWNATTSDQVNVLAAVLENGETWGLYTLSDGLVVGALQGAAKHSAENNVSVSASFYDMISRKVVPRSYAGKYSVRDKIELTASNAVKLTGSYNASYESPSALSEAVGVYSGVAVANLAPTQQSALTVSLGGLVSVAANPGCTIRGAMTSRASGRNVFDVKLNFTGSTCPLKDGMVTQGVGLYNSVTQSFVLMSLDGTKVESYIYSGKKT